MSVGAHVVYDARLSNMILPSVCASFNTDTLALLCLALASTPTPLRAFVSFSRQLIGRLTKLARSGLWKASFKVLRVEQALNARKAAVARENGEVS